MKILELTDVKEWSYVSTGENPADDCSRGLEPTDAKWDRFLNGPGFLRQPDSEWPDQSRDLGIGKNEKLICLNLLTIGSKKISCNWAVQVGAPVGDWPTKIRRIAVLRKFVRLWRDNRKKKFPLIHLSPTVGDMKDAEKLLVLGIQQACFAKEIEGLCKNPSA